VNTAAMRLVSEPPEVASLAVALAGSAEVGFDCEFLSQDRLVPQLCLLQLVFEEQGVQQIAMVDCLAVDVRPLAEALAAHPRPIAHAPRQDLQLLAIRFGVEVPQVFDLQTAAAFLGLGDQLGYAKLVAALLGFDLAKDLQWTDWARRPLSAAQLAYAAADVEHLLPLYRALVTRLGPRTGWALDESRRLAEVARQAAELREEDAWEAVSGSGALPPRALAAVVELAGWRLRMARELDLPLGHVISDKKIVELARRPPRDLEALRRRVESAAARERTDELMGLFDRAERNEPPPRSPRRGPLPRRAEAWVSGLLLIVELVSGQEQIAPRLLATRAEVEALARAFDARGDLGIADHPAMNGWRRALIGELCAGWLRGELAIVTDGSNDLDNGAVAPARDGAAAPASVGGSSVRLVPRPATSEPA
jgi:ribonuclease D